MSGFNKNKAGNFSLETGLGIPVEESLDIQCWKCKTNIDFTIQNIGIARGRGMYSACIQDTRMTVSCPKCQQKYEVPNSYIIFELCKKIQELERRVAITECTPGIEFKKALEEETKDGVIKSLNDSDNEWRCFCNFCDTETRWKYEKLVDYQPVCIQCHK